MNGPTRGALAATLGLAVALAVSACGSRHADPGAISGATPSPGALVPMPTPVKADPRLLPQRPIFGISVPDTSQANIDAVADTTGCRPQVVNRFVSVLSGVSFQTLAQTPGLPMISLEPWHAGEGPDQPDFTLRATIDGKWDKQYKAVAKAVAQYGHTVLIRYAHEMNAIWYPWGVANGNTAADFPKAWQHVVNLFRQAGATNVLWIWSPNILRGAASVSLSQFWPGDGYVDFVGMTGFGKDERSPSQTFDPTITAIRALTKKPVLLTEIGADAGSDKSTWIAELGAWLKQHTEVLGFVWYEHRLDPDDWRFDDTANNLALFKGSLKTAGVKC
jgi:hypothetical protein